MTDNVFTVSEITGSIKYSLEQNFSEITVIGELSNFKAHVSGHWYFTLKDSGAQLSGTMWRGINNYVFFTPQDGMKVIVSGKITVYPPRGSYQMDVRSMKPAGVGELQAAFERLKQKLSDEGLFDGKYKKDIPEFVHKIGIVTAIDGAAFQDMKSVAQRRFPIVEIVIASSKVQGDGAAEEIASRINELNQLEDIDLIIIGRGGGSLEDLWAFNEEIVARSIFNSKIPIISAVGHEIDFTISDFVADLRAPTPSAAMELATPDGEALLDFIENFSNEFYSTVFDKFSDYRSNLEKLLNSYGFKRPQDIVHGKSQLLDSLYYKFQNGMKSKFTHFNNKLELINSKIETNNISLLMKKGFVLIEQNGSIVKRKNDLVQRNNFKIKFFDGEVNINE